MRRGEKDIPGDRGVTIAPTYIYVKDLIKSTHAIKVKDADKAYLTLKKRIEKKEFISVSFWGLSLVTQVFCNALCGHLAADLGDCSGIFANTDNDIFKEKIQDSIDAVLNKYERKVS